MRDGVGLVLNVKTPLPFKFSSTARQFCNYAFGVLTPHKHIFDISSRPTQIPRETIQFYRNSKFHVSYMETLHPRTEPLDAFFGFYSMICSFYTFDIEIKWLAVSINRVKKLSYLPIKCIEIDWMVTVSYLTSSAYKVGLIRIVKRSPKTADRCGPDKELNLTLLLPFLVRPRLSDRKTHPECSLK